VADPDELREEVRVTLLHETGHFFGLSDAELEEMGLG
jgi:predicted Zn-dependent protease with MMP-like domain